MYIYDYGGGKMHSKVIDNMILKRRGKVERKKIPNPLYEWPVTLVSDQMGCNRGVPIDRYYIEKFLDGYADKITGKVMEIGDNSYTIKYGKHVTESYILTAALEDERESSEYVIYGDLQTGKGCKENCLNCFILTQTLPFIYDVKSAAQNIVGMLKKGGVALITVSGISMLSRYDDERWGHYWGFTETSLRKIFEGLVENDQIKIVSMGNAKTASAFLYGLSVEDMKKEDFEENDPLVPVMIGAVIQK